MATQTDHLSTYLLEKVHLDRGGIKPQGNEYPWEVCCGLCSNLLLRVDPLYVDACVSCFELILFDSGSLVLFDVPYLHTLSVGTTRYN